MAIIFRLLTPLSKHEEKIYLYVNPTTQKRLTNYLQPPLLEDFFPFTTGVVDMDGAP
jgi:hypothetical protein